MNHLNLIGRSYCAGVEYGDYWLTQFSTYDASTQSPLWDAFCGKDYADAVIAALGISKDDFELVEVARMRQISGVMNVAIISHPKKAVPIPELEGRTVWDAFYGLPDSRTRVCVIQADNTLITDNYGGLFDELPELDYAELLAVYEAECEEWKDAPKYIYVVPNDWRKKEDNGNEPE